MHVTSVDPLLQLIMLVHEGEKVKAKILSDYFISVLTQEPEIIDSLPEVVDANPQNLLEVFTILQDTFRKKLRPRPDKCQCIAKLPKFIPSPDPSFQQLNPIRLPSPRTGVTHMFTYT